MNIKIDFFSSDMNDVIYRALCACFGLSPSSAEASVLIREAYQEPENAPRLPRTADVIYYSLQLDTGASEAFPAYAVDNPSSASHIPAVLSFSAWKLQVICYGPNAEKNARRIRALIFIDGAGMPRCPFRLCAACPGTAGSRSLR